MFYGWSLILINVLLSSDSCFFLYLYLKTESTVVGILWLTICTLNRSNSYHPTTCGYSYNTMHYEILYICCMSYCIWDGICERLAFKAHFRVCVPKISEPSSPPISQFFPHNVNVAVLYLLLKLSICWDWCWYILQRTRHRRWWFFWWSLHHLCICVAMEMPWFLFVVVYFLVSSW